MNNNEVEQNETEQKETKQEGTNFLIDSDGKKYKLVPQPTEEEMVARVWKAAFVFVAIFGILTFLAVMVGAE